MPIEKIPVFIKNMGHKVISFILNIEEKDGIAVLNEQHELDGKRAEVLLRFIKICRQLRVRDIDDGDVDLSMIYSLPRILQDDRHVFNLWREELGGERFNIDVHDPVVFSATKIALEIFPIFLMNRPGNGNYFLESISHLNILIHSLSEGKKLIAGIMADPSLSKLFNNAAKSEMEAQCEYMASSGRGGVFQLAVFPASLISNSYELMKLRGNVSRDALLLSIAETVEMLRVLAEGNQVEVPAFIGFHNVGLDDFSEIEIEGGKIRGYNEEILSLIPTEARPSSLAGENKVLGLILEYRYPYSVVLGEQKNDDKWPPELEQLKKRLGLVGENLALTLALAVNRDPAIGINQAWNLVFDPLCQGVNISWRYGVRSPMPYYLLKKSEVDAVSHWYKTINETEDGKIRLAIRRILSSINDRTSPIDAFIDSIISWENLFGGNAELSYRISISIAKLLKEKPEERSELQRKIVKYYSERSKVLHGVEEMSSELATKKRDECIRIALDAMKKLYAEHRDLISNPERARVLALL